jgi:hypothetical protein
MSSMYVVFTYNNSVYFGFFNNNSITNKDLNGHRSVKSKYIIRIKWKTKISLLIEVPVPNLEGDGSCICVLVA